MELHHLERKKSSDLSVQSVHRPEHTNPSSSKELPVYTLEGTRPSSKMSKSVASLRSEASVPRQKMARLARIQFLTLCWTLFLIGWNDSSTGPLIPRIREHYNVGFMLVSLIFVFACLGFLIGAVANIYLTDKVAFGKTIVLGGLCLIVGNAIQSSAPPFPVFVMAYIINGFGLALGDSQSNGFVASLQRNAETKMGILHAAYGIGAFAAPLAATQFAQLHRWSFHFLVSLGIAILNVTFLVIVFKLNSQDECLAAGGEVIPESTSASEENTSNLRNVMRSKAVHLLALFTLIYVGVEVTIGGWIVTFVIEQRHGGPSSGYISSGFYGGLTIGRVALLWVNKKVGEKRVLFIYTILCIGLELTIWLIPSLIGNAVAVAFVGLFLGPMYPITMNQASRILPRWMLTGGIGWIAGFGQAGSALLPFITGAIASERGISSLQPLLVGMMAFMMALWSLVPAEVRRPD